MEASNFITAFYSWLIFKSLSASLCVRVLRMHLHVCVLCALPNIFTTTAIFFVYQQIQRAYD